MTATLRDRLTEFLDMPDSPERLAIPFRFPGLFSEEFLAAEANRRTASDAARAHGIAELSKLADALRAGELPYLIGPGPIERLMELVERGEITEATALASAAEKETGDQMSPLYGTRLLASVFQRREEEPVERLLLWLRLIRAAARARTPGLEAAGVCLMVDLDFIKIAQQYLCKWADGRLYREANEIGEQLLKVSEAGDGHRGELLHILGTLSLDPYSAGRTNAWYASQIQAWNRMYLNAHRLELQSLPDAEWSMPEPAVALERSIGYLERAASVRTGHEKGLSLKALAQAIVWRAVAADEDVDKAKLQQVGSEALKFLDVAIDPQHVAAAMAMLTSADVPPDAEQIRRLLRISIDDCARRQGPHAASDLFRQALQALRHVDLDEVMTLIPMVRALFEVYPSEAGQSAFSQFEISLLAEWGEFKLENKSAEGLKSLAEQLLQGETAEKVDAARAAARLLAVADVSGRFNEEEWGLGVIDAAERLAPVFCRRHAPAVEFLRTSLLQGLAVNSFNAKQMPDAVRWYARAVRGRLQSKLPEAAVTLADKLRDCVEKAGAEIVDAVVEALFIMARELIQQTPDAGRQMILRICRQAAATAGGKWSTRGFMLLQFAKGFEFSAALVEGVAHLRGDETGKELLNEIVELEASLDAALPADPGVADGTGSAGGESDIWARELQLVAFQSPKEALEGEGPATRLANLRRAYDDHLNEMLFRGQGERPGLVLSFEEVQAALDARTVLAFFFMGRDQQRRTALQVFLLSRERVQAALVALEFPASVLNVEVGGRKLMVDPAALSVATLREAIQRPAGNRDVCDDAAKILDFGISQFFGDVQLLERFRAEGKDHLCIAPHGALHYFPFHLLNYLGSPLAASWGVSFLPNLNLLVAGRGRPHLRWHRGLPLASVGLSYAEPEWSRWGLSLLEDAIDEARDVAALFDVEPIVESSATVAEVKRAMTQAKFVHLSVHGSQAPEAPAFHCMFLAPDADSDGRLCAHDVIRWDLRGVDLLTLSACESGLGRFDAADNLRGMPASFLLAGVSTIVGTLWDVSADVARTFFTGLYRELHAGSGKLNAFQAAQREARAQFPKYVDWGAFYLSGEWY